MRGENADNCSDAVNTSSMWKASESSISSFSSFQLRGLHTAAPISGYFARLAFQGAQAGGGAFARSLPVMFLLSIVLPHRLRVRRSPILGIS